MVDLRNSPLTASQTVTVTVPGYGSNKIESTATRSKHKYFFTLLRISGNKHWSRCTQHLTWCITLHFCGDAPPTDVRKHTSEITWIHSKLRTNTHLLYVPPCGYAGSTHDIWVIPTVNWNFTLDLMLRVSRKTTYRQECLNLPVAHWSWVYRSIEKLLVPNPRSSRTSKAI